MIRKDANDAALLERFQALSRTGSFNQWAGFEVVRVVEGEVDIRMPWRASDMGQYAGFLHAGLIAALDRKSVV